MRTVESEGATFSTCLSTWLIALEEPTNLLKHRRAVDFFSQHQIFVAEPLFRLLLVVDISCSNVPAAHVAVLVSQRVVLIQVPAIFTVPMQHSQFSRPLSRSLAVRPAESLSILTM
jgi:hypothetical protein